MFMESATKYVNFIETTDKVKELCEFHNVKPLYIALTGSRAYGYPKSDSDQDATFIFYREPINYFSVSEIKDEIRHPELDIKGWDLRKFLNILSKSGWNACEMLMAPSCFFGNVALPGAPAPSLIIKELKNYMQENVDKNKLISTLICCAEKYNNNAWHVFKNAKKPFEELDKASQDKFIKNLLGEARLILSAAYIHTHGFFPEVNLNALIEDTLNEMMVENYDLKNYNFLASSIRQLAAARIDDCENMISSDIIQVVSEGISDIGNKIATYHIADKARQEIVEKNQLALDKILKDFMCT